MLRLHLLLILIIYCCTATAFTLYGHRGARGICPENSLPAYKKALELGVDYIDMDVMMTKDHVVVVQHNFTLNPDITRKADHQWLQSDAILVKNLTLKQLQTYDVGRIKPNTPYSELFKHQQGVDGTYIPTLKQVIEYAKKIKGKNIGFQIEIKTDPTQPTLSHSPEEIASAVAQIIQDEEITDRTQVQAYDWRCLEALQKINPHIITAYITDQDQEKIMHDYNSKVAGAWTAGKLLKNYGYSIPRMIKAMGGKCWDPQDTTVTLERIKEAHQLGLKVIVWSWPEQSGKEIDIHLIQRLIDMGVDGIITDRPDLVKKMYGKI